MTAQRNDWAVTVELEGAGPLDDDRIDHLLTNLADVAVGGISVTDTRTSTTITVRAHSVSKAVDAAVKRLAALLPDWTVIAADAMTEARHAEALEAPLVPELVGVSEVAKIAGVSRQRAHQLAAGETFPSPVATLAAGPVWRAAAVRAWAEQPRASGRPKNVGVMVPVKPKPEAKSGIILVVADADEVVRLKMHPSAKDGRTSLRSPT